MSESNNNIPMRITQLEEATAYEDGMYYAVAKAGSGTKKIDALYVNGNISDLKENQNTEVKKLYQYMDQSKLNEGYFWNNGVKQAHSTFNCYDPMFLPSGEYHLMGVIYGFSYIKVDGEFVKWADFFGSTSYLTDSDFTLVNDSIIYISVNKNTNAQVRIINKTDISVYSIPYNKGYIRGEINNKVKFNSEYFDQCFIKNGELTCNNDHQSAYTSVAKYNKVDMGSNVKKIMCKGYFKDVGNVGASITLISTKLSNYTNVQNITRGSIHVGFTPDHVGVEVIIDNVRTTIQEFSYTMTANTQYTFGWSIQGDTITVYLPDGAQETVTDERFSDLLGQYLIFEPFRYLNSPTDKPTDDWGQPVICGIYGECDNGHPLRDNFQRADGGLSVSPTGHTYIQFRNRSAEGDTIFDNEGGSSN